MKDKKINQIQSEVKCNISKLKKVPWVREGSKGNKSNQV